MSTNGSATLQSSSYRALANPTEFEYFLSGNAALAERSAWAKAVDYDHRVCKLDSERHFRVLVLFCSTDLTSGRDLSDAAEENLLFQATGSDFDISVAGFGDEIADRPIDPDSCREHARSGDERSREVFSSAPAWNRGGELG